MTSHSIFRDTPADNIAAIKTWHEKHHHASSWATCAHEPCSVTTAKFREQWQ